MPCQRNQSGWRAKNLWKRWQNTQRHVWFPRAKSLSCCICSKHKTYLSKMSIWFVQMVDKAKHSTPRLISMRQVCFKVFSSTQAPFWPLFSQTHFHPPDHFYPKFAAPAEVIKALKVYCNSFYGSCLWDLAGEKAGQVYSAWNFSVKLAWGCPQQTRTYFVQQLLNCGYTSARVDLLARFSKFFYSLRNSVCHEVQVLSRFVARDVMMSVC